MSHETEDNIKSITYRNISKMVHLPLTYLLSKITIKTFDFPNIRFSKHSILQTFDFDNKYHFIKHKMCFLYIKEGIYLLRNLHFSIQGHKGIFFLSLKVLPTSNYLIKNVGQICPTRGGFDKMLLNSDPIIQDGHKSL